MSILLTPARIGSVEIRNRIVMPPMTTRLSDKDDKMLALVTQTQMVIQKEG